MATRKTNRRSSTALGAAAEAVVRNSMVADGWHILATNWRGGGGEIDVLAIRQGILRVVEVKSRARTGRALEAVSRTKQRRITQATHAFLAANPVLQPEQISFCVVAIEAGRMEWLEDAFDADETECRRVW